MIKSIYLRDEMDVRVPARSAAPPGKGLWSTVSTRNNSKTWRRHSKSPTWYGRRLPACRKLRSPERRRYTGNLPLRWRRPILRTGKAPGRTPCDRHRQFPLRGFPQCSVLNATIVFR